MEDTEEMPSASGVQTYLELGWTGSHINFGSGYDLINRSLRASALEPFRPNAESAALDYQSDVYTIDTQEALKSKIKVDVKASIPLDGVKIEASAGYLNSEAVSSKSMLHIIKEVIDQPPVKADIQTLRLTEKAQALLAEDKGVEKFRAQYGDYFVYACCSKSSFTAIYDFKASSKEVLNEVKASLKLKTDVADAIANTNVSILKKESSVTIAVRLDIKGYEASKDTEGSLINTKEVETTFKKFQANAKPQPYLALLCHYSAIDGRIPGP